ncbi:MAG: hypothetical protein ACLUAR_11665 [Pilosibacter sp.]
MGERNVIKAALLGAGTVGSGVYALAEMLKDEMFQKTGASLEIKKVLVRNTKKDRPGIPKEIMTDNWQEILEDEEIQLVIGAHGRRGTGENLYRAGPGSRKTGGHRQQGRARGARTGDPVTGGKQRLRYPV